MYTVNRRFVFFSFMVMFLFFISVGFAEEKGSVNIELFGALRSALSSQCKGIQQINAQGDPEAFNTIPRVGGNWEATGAGTINGQRLTARGSISIVSYIDTDGYEVVTQLSQVYDVYDSYGRYIDRYSENVALNLKINLRCFTIQDQSVRDTYSIESETYVTRRRTGNIDGNTIDFTWYYSRGGSNGSSGGGGCSTGAIMPLMALLALPLFILYLKNNVSKIISNKK